MYRNGLSFPIFYFFLNDNIIINDLEDIINQKKLFEVTSEEQTNSAIIEFINNSKGYEIYPFLLNHFSYLIQSNLKLNREVITSKFVKKTEFISLINTFKIDFLKIKNLIIQINEVGLIDNSIFYSELYSLLYKRFALKLGQIVNYSDFEGSKLFFDFNKDFKSFEVFSAEIENARPNLIRNYDYKKQYITSFFKSFNSNDVDDILNKIEVVKNHSDRLIILTFRELVKKSFIVNEKIIPKIRNKSFKPIFAEINSAINGKVYGAHNEESLTKEVKRFFFNM